MPQAPHNQNDVLFWTSQDLRQSQLYSTGGVVYRFQVCIIDIACALNGPDLTPLDRYKRTRPQHNHRMARDTSEQRRSGGQTGVGPQWWPGTRCYRKGEAFASRNSPFDLFLTLMFDHRTKFLWPTWSRRDPRVPVCFSFISISFHLTWATRIREFSTAQMVTCTSGDQVLPARTLW
jgi:hypothetical protein